MGLFRKTRAEPAAKPEARDTGTIMDAQDLLLEALLGRATINRSMALSIPAVSSAVDFIAATIASMPVRLYRVDTGNVIEQTEDPRVRLLNADTGDTLNAWQMRKAMITDYLLGKGGYCYIQRHRNRVTGLYYVPDCRISVEVNNDPIRKSFSLLVGDRRYEPWDFVKLLRNTQDGASGTGLVAEVANVIETAFETLRYQLTTAKAGGSKKGFVKSQKKLGQPEIDALKAAWRRLYNDGTEAVVILNNGLDFQEASVSASEMQLNENKRTLTDEINNIFHLSQDFNLTFKMAVMPIVKAFETELNRVLLLEKEKRSMYFSFDVSEATRATVRERYEAYKIAKEAKFLTINEIRRMENLSDIPGMDVIDVGLASVLYDIKSGTYYTPNTGTVGGTTPEAEPQHQEGGSADEADNQI